MPRVRRARLAAGQDARLRRRVLLVGQLAARVQVGEARERRRKVGSRGRALPAAAAPRARAASPTRPSSLSRASSRWPAPSRSGTRAASGGASTRSSRRRADEHEHEQEPREVVDLARDEQDQRDGRRAAPYAQHPLAHQRREEAAHADRARRRARRPRRRGGRAADAISEPERAAEELGEDVPRVAARRPARLVSVDELVTM